ncbi:MAG: hypothetical protein ABL963_00410 [Longimicrobiales bacterium]
MADHAMGPSGAFAGASAGTSRQPLSGEMDGVHGQLGSWSVMTHAIVTLNSRWGAEPRGGTDYFFTNNVMVSGRRFSRLEWATKDELFPATDLRHSESFRVSKWDAGLVQDVTLGGVIDLGIGASPSVHFVADALEAEYGSTPIWFMVFTRTKL